MSAGTRIDLLGFAAFAAILFVVGLGARDLWTPNEPTYGQAVVEMQRSGDWVVPTVGGKVFAEKPILYFWLALAASALLGGVSELALRLPLALAGVASVLWMYLLVEPYAGRLRARLATALYATIFMVWWGARAVQMDFLVAVSTLATLLAVSRVVDGDTPAGRGWTLAGLAAGLGFAAKGPVALVLPGLTTLVYLAWTRRLGALRTPALFAGAAAFLATAAPWYALLAARGRSDVLAEVLVRQNFARFLDAWDHVEPWWYYLKYFWIDMLPWGLFVPLAVGLSGRDARERRLDQLAWVWLCVVLAFFSLSTSKRSAYILPLAPAVAVLVAGVAERLWNGTLPAVRRRAALALASLVGVALAGAGAYFAVRVAPDYPERAREVRALAALLCAGGAAVVFGLVRPVRSRLVPATLFALVTSVYLISSISVLPSADLYKSPRGFTEHVNRIVPREQALASFGFWDWRAGYTFYARRPIPDLGTPDELRAYWERDERVFLIVLDDRLPEARAVLGPRAPLVAARVGSKTAYLFANDRPHVGPRS